MKVKGVKSVQNKIAVRPVIASGPARRAGDRCFASARTSRDGRAVMRPSRRAQRGASASAIAAAEAGDQARRCAPASARHRARAPPRARACSHSQLATTGARTSRRPVIVHEPSIRASRPGSESKRRSRARPAHAARRPRRRLRARVDRAVADDQLLEQRLARTRRAAGWPSAPARAWPADRRASGPATAAGRPAPACGSARATTNSGRAAARAGARGATSAGIRLWKSGRRRRAARVERSAPRTSRARRSDAQGERTGCSRIVMAFRAASVAAPARRRACRAAATPDAVAGSRRARARRATCAAARAGCPAGCAAPARSGR